MFNAARIRLTLWYAGGFGLVLLLFSAGVYQIAKAALYHRVDAEVISLARAAEVALRSETAEGESPQAAARSVVNELNLLPQEAIGVFSAGHVLAERGAVDADQLRLALVSHAEQQSGYQFVIRSVAVADRRYDMVISHALSSVDDDLAVLRRVLIGAVPVGIMLAGLAGWFLSQKALLPIAMMFGQQRQFMTDASHEMRTPLTVISSAVDVALDRPRRSEEEYRDTLGMIAREAHRLRRLVEDMFTLARADAGQLTMQPKAIYLDEVVADAIDAARLLALDKRIDVEMIGQAELPYKGDESMLSRLMLNLLDNAIRHSPHGATVEVKLEKRASGYAIIVADCGDGVPSGARDLIFTRFFQADTARTHDAANRRGAGLGLPIARWVAESHGGSLELQSSDRGSTFVVVLPYEGASLELVAD
jgi:two-component system OmpR family sensor kinase